jgi:hypothetical protein
VAQQEIDVEAVSVSVRVAAGSMGWEVAPRVESGGVRRSEVSKRDLVGDIHGCGETPVGYHPMGLRYCCESCVASECTDVLGAELPAHQRSAARCLG